MAAPAAVAQPPASPFQNTLCGCFDDAMQCLDTIFCFYCQVGRQCSAIDGHKNMANCGMCCVTCCFPYITPIVLRFKVVSKYNLEENGAVTCLLAWLCVGPSTCQTGRELNTRGTNPGGTICAPEDAAPMGEGSAAPAPAAV